MIKEKWFYMMAFGMIGSVVLMSLIFSAFIVREKHEKEEWKAKYEALERAVVRGETSGDLDSVHTSLPICKEK